jgi:effector-binding domain-containing protein
MLNKIILAGLVIVTIFVGGGVLLPQNYHVERSIVIARPASVIFAVLNSYQNFNQWSPWASRDPNAVYQMSGPEAGTGARLSWKGEPRTVGEGWQQISGSIPVDRIDIEMDFGEQGTAQSFFKLTPTGTEAAPSTEVIWGFDTDVTKGKSLFGAMLGRYFGLFLNRWIGADYEQGLSSLKIYAEALPAADFEGSNIEIVFVEPVEILFVSGSSSQAANDIAAALAAAFGEIIAFMGANDIQLAGQPMAITHGWDENGYQFDAALPVNRLPESLSGNIQSGLSPSGQSVKYNHIGPYDQMLSAYEELASYMAANGLQEGEVSWEHYISNPGDTPEEEIITHIYFLIGD